jgi:hypothetical protein
MKRTFIRSIIENGVTFCFAFLQLVLTRWMLFLSTPKEDLKNLPDVLWYLQQLAWYRGNEYMHQLRYRRIIHANYQF